jgi:amino-acid N-acetyltransferase
MIIHQAKNYKEQVTTLLASEKLPVADLPQGLENFLVAIQDKTVIGVIGVEVYGKYGLLRSLAVAPGHRSSGIASALISRIETFSGLKNLDALYLLTETAPGYFKQKGFTQVEREQIPAEVQVSSEFSHVCPVSAIVMKKNFKPIT